MCIYTKLESYQNNLCMHKLSLGVCQQCHECHWSMFSIGVYLWSRDCEVCTTYYARIHTTYDLRCVQLTHTHTVRRCRCRCTNAMIMAIVIKRIQIEADGVRFNDLHEIALCTVFCSSNLCCINALIALLFNNPQHFQFTKPL